MTDASAAPLRGGAVGSVTAALAVAAHGMAGGGWPDGAALTLLVVVSIGVGAMTAVPRRSTVLLPALMGGQLLAHIALSLSDMSGMLHSHSLLPSTAMIAFHAAASVVAALLIAAAERLYGPITSIVRAVLALLTPLPDGSAVGRVRFSVALPSIHGTALDWAISRRGPPMSIYSFRGLHSRSSY
ncbi:hypothetical protein CH294_10410 [Rhodococcus sp. 14-2483-1-1]|uniref:hypothetical protein n=1 Tax=Nocardiaceae TaxID=85025 RepID=UPI0006925DBC|nr:MULTISPECIES: hypothetical protein [Rhodococcus]OZE81443.1 hypothetical protein CH305_09350 [Rhodococcus sp. 15-649-2-2]OZF37915.1 hypothetical protein CH294_10410 [Rhodococcus sp. 14-2483-1-1]QIH98779.1 hypothetical protein BH92_01880 [Rhodococcus fascians A21d2]